jgi:hypothetical protein
MVSLVVFILLDILHLVLNTMVGGVVALGLRGATVQGLPFVLSFSSSETGVVPMVVFVVVDLIGLMIWFVLTTH